ncbi:SDR family NAD(P)-dependent oxidoreductase, partial [Exiguobacterium sp.]
MGTYIITGATSGIGEATALQLIREGHTVLAIGRN